MAADDVIRQYLVSLGFKVDNESLAKMQDALKKLSDIVAVKTTAMATNYGQAAAAIVSSLSAIGFATVDLMDKVAQADLGYQKFALRMFMARDAAKQLKIVTDSMGESFGDIAWHPELLERYRALMGQARGMEPPKEAGAQLKYIRDIRYEFTRLKVEATYGLQWIGFYLFKYLAGPLASTRGWLEQVNDWIQKKMPEWSEKIARALTVVYNMGNSVVRAFKEILKVGTTIYDGLPKWAQAWVVFGAAIGGVMLLGPVGKAILVIGVLVALIEDFYGYVDGRKSNPQLAPIWDSLIRAAYEVRRAVRGVVLQLQELENSTFVQLTKSGIKIFFADKPAIPMPGGPGGVSDKGRNRFGPSFTLNEKNERIAIDKSGRPVAAGGAAVDKSSFARGATAGIFSDTVQAQLDKEFPYKTTDELKKEWRRKPGDTWQEGLQSVVPIESGGDYGAVGPRTRKGNYALGKYQIMDFNWLPWAAEAGLKGRPAMTPENQEKVAQYKWAQYYKKYDKIKKYKDMDTNALVAVAWFAGPAIADQLAAGHMQGLANKDVNQLDVRNYLARTGYSLGSQQHTGDTNINVVINAKDANDTAEKLEKVLRRYVPKGMFIDSSGAVQIRGAAGANP